MSFLPRVSEETPPLSPSSFTEVSAPSRASERDRKPKIDNTDSSVLKKSPTSAKIDKQRSRLGRQTIPRRWTKDEDNLLRSFVSSGNTARSASQALFGGNRTASECDLRWTKVISKGIMKGPWTPEEDQMIIMAVAAGGCAKWSDISLPGRVGKQCRERYFNHLDPTLKKGDWTKEEDRTIVHAQLKYGNCWTKISKLLPGRSENAVKNRWNSAAMKRHRPLDGGRSRSQRSASSSASELSDADSSDEDGSADSDNDSDGGEDQDQETAQPGAKAQRTAPAHRPPPMPHQLPPNFNPFAQFPLPPHGFHGFPPGMPGMPIPNPNMMIPNPNMMMQNPGMMFPPHLFTRPMMPLPGMMPPNRGMPMPPPPVGTFPQYAQHMQHMQMMAQQMMAQQMMAQQQQQQQQAAQLRQQAETTGGLTVAPAQVLSASSLMAPAPAAGVLAPPILQTNKSTGVAAEALLSMFGVSAASGAAAERRAGGEAGEEANCNVSPKVVTPMLSGVKEELKSN